MFKKHLGAKKTGGQWVLTRPGRTGR
jgi:hypothetical protein